MNLWKSLQKSISIKYAILAILVTCIAVGSYVSYAMFTVTEEKNNAISIVTGNLYYDLKVDGAASNTLTVPANSFKEFIITLTNTNNRTTRLNLYYVGNVSDEVDVAYIEEGYNSIPTAAGENFANGASKQYKIRVSNTSNSSVTVNLGVEAGLDYNDLSIPSDGHEIRKITIRGLVTDVVKDDIMNRLNTSDSEQTFVTGENPNNYIWYSGKLWRAVSIDPSDNSVKLVTQWNISAIMFSSGNSAFEGSYIDSWLNDTTVDGFLYNLRDYENFIVTDATWDATLDAADFGSIAKPDGTTTVTRTVGLLNVYEYQMSCSGIDTSNGYLNNGLVWWALTPSSASNVRYVGSLGSASNNPSSGYSYGIRPSINLKSSINIVDGDGTEDNPYRLEGDNDTNLNGTLLNTRYSGEYIRFGIGENDLYRIVSHESEGLTKITSAGPLKENGIYKEISYGGANYSSTNTIGTFLNGEYLTSYVDSTYANMIEDSTTWYLGTVNGGESYKLSKYKDTNMTETTTSTEAKVGLLRYGELMASQFTNYNNNIKYGLLTKALGERIRSITIHGDATYNLSVTYSIKPSLNLKSNVIITGGSGTKSDPFVLSLGS